MGRRGEGRGGLSQLMIDWGWMLYLWRPSCSGQPPHNLYRLVGLVVKASPSRATDRGSTLD